MIPPTGVNIALIESSLPDNSEVICVKLCAEFVNDVIFGITLALYAVTFVEI